MAKAEPGQALATSGVLEASALAFETTALEPFMVKGKKKPVEAFVFNGGLVGGMLLFLLAGIVDHTAFASTENAPESGFPVWTVMVVAIVIAALLWFLR